MIAEQLSMEKEVVRVWFCNRRQKEKRINCPVATPIKPPIYNSRLVSDLELADRLAAKHLGAMYVEARSLPYYSMVGSRQGRFST